MEAFDVIKYMFKYATVVVFAYFISDVAMYFDRPGLLWWYIVPLLIAGTSVEKKIEEDDDDE